MDSAFTPANENRPPSRWPWLVDLGPNGQTDVAVPHSGSFPSGDTFRGLRLLDGRTGQARWVRQMRPETPAADGLAHVAEAPDLDGDGTRELAAVSIFAGRRPPLRTPGDVLEQGRST